MNFFIYDRWGTQIGVINDVVSARHKDEINGEDSLTLVLASCQLIKGNRIVWRDKFGDWHENIVNEIEDSHDDKLTSSVYCENSFNECYGDWIEDRRSYNQPAAVAMDRCFDGTRWTVGTVSVTGTGNVNFYCTNPREGLNKIIDVFGGERETAIGVGDVGVTSRTIKLLARRGADNGKRFEYTKDMERIIRRVYADDVCTAIYGFGKGLEAYDEDGNLTGGYERKLRFGEINGGLDYVYDDNAKNTWGLPDGHGGKKHVYGRYDNPECEDMNQLLAETNANLDKRKLPQITYTATVLDLADYGYSFEDVRTGDTVALIDHPLDLVLQGRVLSVDRDLMDESATIITLGYITRNINDVLGKQQTSIERLTNHSAAWDGAASLSASYIDGVINSLNHLMDAIGGYAYYEPGAGIVIYDRARDDNPTMAMQLGGLGFRIANSKTSQGEWNWRTFGTGSGFTADEIVVGILRCGNNIINLNNGTMHLDGSVTIGGNNKTATDLLADVVDAAKTATNFIALDSTGLNIFMSQALLTAGTYQRLTSTAQEWYLNGNLISKMLYNGLQLMNGAVYLQRSDNYDISGGTDPLDRFVISFQSPHSSLGLSAIVLGVVDIGLTTEHRRLELQTDEIRVVNSNGVSYIKSHKADVDWTALFTYNGSYIAWCCKSGVVYVVIDLKDVPSAVTTQDVASVNVIDVGYRPAEDYPSCASIAAAGTATVWVDTGGHVHIQGTVASRYCFASWNYPL